MNGATAAENQFNIDGISTNSIITGASRQDAVFEILQEVQVKTGGVDAEYGGAMGGVISAITKSGGNSLHGDVHYYYSGSKISAGPVQRLLLDPFDDRTVSYQQDHKNPSKTQEVGYALGGAFVKNKLFFFSAASPRFADTQNTYLADNGRNPIVIERDQTFWQVFNKISFDATTKLRGSAFWLWSPTKSNGTLPAYNYLGNSLTTSTAALAPNPNIGYFAPQSNYGGQVDFILTPTSLVTVRGGRFWDNYKDTGIPGISNVTYQTPTPSTPTATFPADLISSIPANLRGGTNFYNTPRYINNFHDLGTRTYVQADYSVFAQFLGSHDLKIGGGVQKNVNNVDQAYPGGGYVFVSLGPFFHQQCYWPERPWHIRLLRSHDFRTQGTTGAKLGNVYAQDKWRIGRLTLNLGVRFESEAIPSFRRDIRDNAFEFGWTDKFAPRLGATYDVTGDGKVKVYGSWGKYYDWVKYQLARGAFGADYWHVYYRGLDTPDAFSLANAVPGAAASNGASLPGKNLWSNVPGSSRDRRVPNFDTVVPGIKPMYSTLTNIGTEIQLSPTMVFRAGYVRNSLGRTIEDLGVLVNGDEVYYYGNPGEGGSTITPVSGATEPFATPKPVRNYNALELSVTRRFANRWLGSASYVYSRLQGNYPGLSNTDEVRTPTSGTTYSNAQASAGTAVRNGDSASRAWDLDEILWDSHGNLDVQGRLPTDRPHVVKLYGSYTFKWGTEIGGNFYGGSGTPLSTYGWTINGIPTFVNGRGDLGRTATFTQTDLLVGHEVPLTEGSKIRFEANVINLFNQKTSRHRFVDYNRQRNSSEMDLSRINLANGYDYKSLVANTTDGRAGNGANDPRFNMTRPLQPRLCRPVGREIHLLNTTQ